MILGRGRGWISRALRFAVYFGFAKHHSAGYRLFSRAPWCADAIGRLIFEAVSQWLGDTIEIAVENMIIANINGGGPVIRLKTLNGDIQINDADMTR